MTVKQKTLMIMAAGTGGHIFPGLAIADTMRARGWQVFWLGTSTGMEGRIVPQHGVTMDTLAFSGMRGKGWLHTITGAGKLLLSFVTCLKILAARKPDVVIGMGGYVTVPGGLMAFLCAKPLVLMNADAGLLLSNRALLPFARKLLFGLPSSAIRQSDKVKLTGNPIRADITQLGEPETRYRARSGRLHILVVGGSLGAKVLNDNLPKALARIPEAQRPLVTHQSGKQHIQVLREAYANAGVQAELLDFIDDMPMRYRAADLVICRAGAITVSELTAAGVASILVPFVASSTSHQQDNAQWMGKEAAAIYLPQSELNEQKLAGLLQSMTREQCMQMAKTAYALGQRQANEAIANVLEELA